LLLASTGGWWWHTDQDELRQAEAEVRATAEWELQRIVASDNLSAVRFTDEQATLYWELHFARVQTAPDAALWGSLRSLETPYFVYHFRQHDAQSVIAAASQIDALYATLRQDFGLPSRIGGEKLVIEVSVTQPPGQAAPWFAAPDHILVPSPAVYGAPVELTDAELLAQSIALPLLAHVLAQASHHDEIGSAWQPLLSGLYLWQVWEMDLPLAVWREETVKWLYLDLPGAGSAEWGRLPDRYEELCAAHILWMPGPAYVGISLLCNGLDHEGRYLVWRGAWDERTRLAQLGVPLLADEDGYAQGALPAVDQPIHTVALATLVEYAVVNYRRERLPLLVAGLGQYESWETLIPAVYGVSPAEFEAGWQAYLAAHYGKTSGQE
jgi:hypothetical protein